MDTLAKAAFVLNHFCLSFKLRSPLIGTDGSNLFPMSSVLIFERTWFMENTGSPKRCLSIKNGRKTISCIRPY